MKIAVLADIHANFIGLQTVSEHIEVWKPDHVIVAGDFINRGPRPLDCLHFLKDKQQSQNWKIIRGNHEDYVLSHADPDTPISGPAAAVHHASFWTYQKIQKEVSYLDMLPTLINQEGPTGDEIRIVHASMRGDRDGIYPETTDEALREKISLNNLDNQTYSLPSVLCVGHTHRSFIRNLYQTLIVNVGSAGLPFDSDHRVAYAQLTWVRGIWDATIIRLNYDRALAEKDFVESGYLDSGGPLTRLVLIELQNAQSHLYYWAQRYQQRVLNSEISMEESVREYIDVLSS
jgi:predicted phosphodiesterase